MEEKTDPQEILRRRLEEILGVKKTPEPEDLITEESITVSDEVITPTIFQTEKIIEEKSTQLRGVAEVCLHVYDPRE